MGVNRSRKRREASVALRELRRSPVVAKAGLWRWEHMPHVVGQPGAVKGLVDAWMNGIYSVQVFEQEMPYGTMTHFVVRRHDGAAVRKWSDMQRIKDELTGRDRVAVELYPPASAVVDDANLYHLWVFPHGMDLGFGLHRWGK